MLHNLYAQAVPCSLIAENFFKFSLADFKPQKEGNCLLSLLPEDILPLFKFSQITDLVK